MTSREGCGGWVGVGWGVGVWGCIGEVVGGERRMICILLNRRGHDLTLRGGLADETVGPDGIWAPNPGTDCCLVGDSRRC